MRNFARKRIGRKIILRCLTYIGEQNVFKGFSTFFFFQANLLIEMEVTNQEISLIMSYKAAHLECLPKILSVWVSAYISTASKHEDRLVPRHEKRLPRVHGQTHVCWGEDTLLHDLQRVWSPQHYCSLKSFHHVVSQQVTYLAYYFEYLWSKTSGTKIRKKKF